MQIFSARTNRLVLAALFGILNSPSIGCGGSRDRFDGGSSSNPGGASGSTAVGTSGSGGSSGSASSTKSGATGATGGTGGVTAPNPYEGVAGALATLKPTWDYNGIIGTGQSLAVGTTPIPTNKSLHNNLMLSLGGATVPPWDPTLAQLSLVPLIERKTQSNFPAPYPANLFGETPHSALANQITEMFYHFTGTDYVTVHSIVGESGNGIEWLKKMPEGVDTTGEKGRAYAASIFEVQAITRLAKAQGKTYGVAAIMMTHGETDSGDPGYRSQLVKLLADYNTDLAAITGQTAKIPMFMSQQFAFPDAAGQRPTANQFQWQLGVELPGQFVCTGPKYQYPGATKKDGVHLSTPGYQQLGEKTGQVYYERIVLGNDWQPLQPTGVTREGRVITVDFHVPVPPLNWDESLPAPDAWPNGKGFEVRAGNTNIAISSVEIVGNQVKITCAADLPANGLTVGYAMTGNSAKMPVASYAWRWGQLRDSDPFVGTTTRVRQPNYCVHFELPVP